MSWSTNEDRRAACKMETCYLDPAIWQELPPLLVALIISKLPILKLIEVVQQCGRFIKQQVMDNPPELLRTHRSNECFFPIFNAPGSGWMSAFGVRYRNWSPMPELNFLPCNVKHVLTGAGGLLCVTSSQPQQYHEEVIKAQGLALKCKERLWMRLPPQPIIVICNPLTRDTQILPPLPGALKYTVAHMKTSACTSNYALYLAGWDEKADAMVVTVYNSKSQAWMGWRSLPNGMRPTQVTSPGESSCVVLNDELWLAGEIRWAGIWEPRILCFDFITQNWKCELHWLPTCEPPRIVEADDCLYAVTRLSEKPYTLHIFEIIGTCEKTCLYSNFEEIARMPQSIHCNFFEIDVRRTRPGLVRWECRAGRGFIFFHNIVSGRLAWYHARAAMKGRENCWGMTNESAPKFESGYTSMVNCIWQPSFAALV
ncbi:hypothetical protein KC19_5G197600 [Ceratodon purpureus]|uniref:F-box domain-containing protein n=1 Tax=Ceratodon purpureus TaxID=3225 RepID=A0A8T0I6G5_CERPU|nr:hypothetical protein KC19_5G197600 [Ceratodon purpureus]